MDNSFKSDFRGAYTLINIGLSVILKDTKIYHICITRAVSKFYICTHYRMNSHSQSPSSLLDEEDFHVAPHDHTSSITSGERSLSIDNLTDSGLGKKLVFFRPVRKVWQYVAVFCFSCWLT